MIPLSVDFECKEFGMNKNGETLIFLFRNVFYLRLWTPRLHTVVAAYVKKMKRQLMKFIDLLTIQK